MFSEGYKAPKYAIGTRDRCDYTIDRIRTVRSAKYRYIKNYFPDRPLMQPGYRDHQMIVKDMRRLHKEGQLTPYQAQHWFGTRPQEELYDIANVPHQLNNLAGSRKYRKVLKKHRMVLKKWIKKTGDKSQFPESSAQLKATYELWEDRPRFRDAKVNPEYNQFKKKSNY